MKIKELLKSLILPIIFIISNGLLIITFSFIYLFTYYHKNPTDSYEMIINSKDFSSGLNNFINDFSILIVLISFVIFMPILIKKYKRFKIESKKLNSKDVIVLVLIAITLSLFLNIGLYLLPFNNTSSTKLIITTLISTGLLGPILEEFLFRGYLYNKLKIFYNKKTAVILTSIIFALFHLNLCQMIYAFIFGIFLALIYDKYQTLKAPIIMHISANTLILLIFKYIISLNLITLISLMIINLIIFGLLYIYKTK